MSLSFDDIQVGGQLRVGTGYCAPIKEGDFKINGSGSAEGPFVFGDGTKIKLGAVGGDPDSEDKTGAPPANLMVTRFGFSNLGPIAYDSDKDSIFLGKDIMTSKKSYSQKTSKEIDKQIIIIANNNSRN